MVNLFQYKTQDKSVIKNKIMIYEKYRSFFQ